MAVLTLNPQEFLQPRRLEGLVNTQLETDLQFINMFNVVPQTETSFAYGQDLVTATEDYEAGTTGEPLDVSELADLPEVEVSPITQKKGMLQPFGFKIRVSKKDMNRGAVIDDLSRAVFRGTQIMARKMDDKVIDQLQAVNNDITEVSGAAVWSDDGATIATDIINFQKAFDIEGYKAQLGRLYVHKDNFYEAKNYFSDLKLAVSGNPANVGDQDMISTGLGTDIYRARSAKIAEGGYVGFDVRPGFQPITIHAYKDPNYAASEQFPLVNIFQYEEPGYAGTKVTEFVADMFPALKLPNSACYKSSGI